MWKGRAEGNSGRRGGVGGGQLGEEGLGTGERTTRRRISILKYGNEGVLNLTRNIFEAGPLRQIIIAKFYTVKYIILKFSSVK